MLNIHRDIEISTDAVLDELSKASRRINIKLLSVVTLLEHKIYIFFYVQTSTTIYI